MSNMDRHQAARLDAWLTREPDSPPEDDLFDAWEDYAVECGVPVEACEHPADDPEHPREHHAALLAHNVYRAWEKLTLAVDEYAGWLQAESEAAYYAESQAAEAEIEAAVAHAEAHAEMRRQG